MAIRFDIDKYRDVREKYLMYLKGEFVPSLQYNQLYNTYKSYWQNDKEIKAAEIAYKQKKEQEEDERWRIRELYKEREKERKNKREESQKEDTLFAGPLRIKTTQNGDCTNLEKIKTFIQNTKTISALNKMLVDLHKMTSSDVINAKTYAVICSVIIERRNFLKCASRNRKIASKPNNFFKVVNQETTECIIDKREYLTTSPNLEKSKPIKHRSVWTCSGGIPGLGKRS